MLSINKNNRKFWIYFEIFILFFMTVGPIDPLKQIPIYVVVLFINIKFLSWYKKTPLLLLLIILSMVISMIVDISNISLNNPYSLAGFAYLVPFLFCIPLIRKYNKEIFLNCSEKVSFVFCALSLLGVAIFFTNRDLILKLPTITYYGRTIHTCGFFGVIKTQGYSLLMRNSGFAFEPGAFQFVANLGLAITILNSKNTKTIRLIIKYLVYLLTIITTQSTTGIIIAAILLLFSVFKNKKNLIFVLLVVGISFGAISRLIDIQISKMDLGAFSSRFENTLYVLKNYSTYLFGVGSTGYNAIYSSNMQIGSWDLYTNLLLRFGWPFIILFVILLLKMLPKDYMIFCVVFLTLLTESILGPMVVMILYICYKDKLEERKHEKGIMDLQCADRRC